MRFLARLALAAGIILTLGIFAGHAQNISDAQRGEIEKIIREYLIAHPEVLQDAMAELEKKQAADEAAKNQAAVRPTRRGRLPSPKRPAWTWRGSNAIWPATRFARLSRRV